MQFILPRERHKICTFSLEQNMFISDESKILDLLPNKMRSDVALDLHVETLSKVKLFQNCEIAFLRDLVVKLRSIIFLPGDYVCRKVQLTTMYAYLEKLKACTRPVPGEHRLIKIRSTESLSSQGAGEAILFF
jgi:hypothetical protein